MPSVLSNSFFCRSAEQVARELLGAIIVSKMGGRVVQGVVTETEAYLGFGDPASHAFQGRRHPGNEMLYSPPGHWYVYRSYGIHWCANVVTGPARIGAAVLLRGVRVEIGESVARRRRGGAARLADGPGKLCQALGIDRSLDGVRVSSSQVRLRTGETPRAIAMTPRIGISKARDWPLRFVWLEKERGAT